MKDKDSGCLDRYCNGKEVCKEVIKGTTNQYLCDCIWCKFHPNYEKDNYER